jgi:hypothetical protein
MARRAPKRRSANWWAIAVVVVLAALAVLWFRARRAEAPGLPASLPGARALSESPPDGHDHGHGEITAEEKADLERIIRERGAASPGP